MKITDGFKLTSYTDCPMYDPCFNPVHVSDMDLDELIKQLQEKGIKIDRDDSEKDISYTVKNDLRTSKVPLDTVVQKETSVTGYALRNDHLEIVLKNYDERHSDGKRRIGGRVHTTSGITCSISFEGEYEAGKIVEEAVQVVKDVYSDLLLGKKPVQRV